MNLNLSKVTIWSSALVITLAFTSCSKKPDAAVTAPVAPVEASPTDVVKAAPQAAVLIATQDLNPSALNGKVSEAQAAIKAKDYQKATSALSISQNSLSSLTADQLVAYNKAKAALAQSVIGAAAAGDPNAQTAMEKLRQDALYHR